MSNAILSLTRLVEPILPGRRIRPVGSLPESEQGVLALVWLWWDRAVGRARLRELDPHMLMDIGVSAEKALEEGRKPFWMP